MCGYVFDTAIILIIATHVAGELQLEYTCRALSAEIYVGIKLPVRRAVFCLRGGDIRAKSYDDRLEATSIFSCQAERNFKVYS